MLREIVDKKHYCFHQSFSNWQDAIRASCQPLEDTGVIDESYQEEIIRCVEKYGPYIVLVPKVAMPHSQENAKGVKKTAVSFMKVEEPVVFDEDDREKDAHLFFTLASEDHDKHLENLMALSELLSDEKLLEELLQVKDIDQLNHFIETHNL